METSIGRAGRGEAGAGPAVTALNGEQPGGLTGRAGLPPSVGVTGRAGLPPKVGVTGRAGLPPNVGVEARYERLAVTHSTTIGQLPTLSIGFIDKVQHRNPPVAAARPRPRPAPPAARHSAPRRYHRPARHSAPQPVPPARAAFWPPAGTTCPRPASFRPQNELLPLQSHQHPDIRRECPIHAARTT
jgi:hypothetical protein